MLREAFIGAQRVSVHAKDQVAKALLKEHFQEFDRCRTSSKLTKATAAMIIRLAYTITEGRKKIPCYIIFCTES